MKIPLTIRPLPVLLLSATLGLGALRAGNFPDHVPGDGLLYLEVADVPANRENIAASPLGGAWGRIDWKQLLVGAYRLGMADGDAVPDQPAADPAELKADLERAEQRAGEFVDHLSGSLAFSAGDFVELADLLKRHGDIRESLHPEPPMGGEGLEVMEDSPDFEQALEREQELDAEEMKAAAAEFRVLADVRDGDALLDKLASWIREDIQEQAAGDEPLKLDTLDWKGLRVFRLTTDSDKQGGEPLRMRDLGDVEPSAAAVPEGVGLWWTVRNGVLAVAFTERGLRDSLRDLGAPPASALSTTRDFREAVGPLGERDFLLFVNPARVDPLIRKGLEGREAEAGNLQPEKILDWLALDALRPYALATRLTPEGIRTRARMGFTRETPISRILIDPTEEPAPTPPWVHRDYQQVSSFNWHLGDAWTRIERELTALAPEAAAGMGVGRMLLTSQVGFDIKLQFLDHLAGGVLMAQQIDTRVLTEMMDLAEREDMNALMEFNQRHPTNGQYYLIALEMKNPAAISSALNTLMAKFHPAGAPEPVDFRGQAIHYPLAGIPGLEERTTMASYTLLNDYLLISIGEPELLHKAVTASLDPEARLWRREDYLETRDRLPPRATILEFVSGKQQESVTKVLQNSLSMLMSDEDGGGLPDFTPLGRVVRNSLGVTVRDGLVFDVEGFIRFRPAEE